MLCLFKTLSVGVAPPGLGLFPALSQHSAPQRAGDPAEVLGWFCVAPPAPGVGAGLGPFPSLSPKAGDKGGAPGYFREEGGASLSG